MSIIVNYEGVSLKKPGAYSKVKVANGGAAAPQLGVVAIVGEAEEGDAWANEASIDAVSFSPDQFGDIQKKFGSGNLVDAARNVLSPSADPAITGGAQQVVLMKTNASVKASLALAPSYGTIKAKRAGVNGNNVSASVTVGTGTVNITIADDVQGLSEVSGSIGGTVLFTVANTAADTATLTITPTQISTTKTGAGGAPAITAKLSQFVTVKQLADFLAGNGYTVVFTAGFENLPPTAMDTCAAVNIQTGAYSVKKDQYDVETFFSASGIVDFTATATAGLPSGMNKTYLTGGLKGATSAAAITACFDALFKARVNFIVPLFSRDATDDILEGLTDASSSYAIDAINVGVRSHCASASSIKGRKERQGFVSYKGTWSLTKNKASALSNDRISLACQSVDALAADGSIKSFQPWMLQVMNAGMKAAATVGLPNTYKAPSINGYSHSEFDPETMADEAIDAGITFVEKTNTGSFRFVLDNSTYGPQKDAWIYARPAVRFAADVLAYTVRLNLEQFVGTRNSDVSAESIKNTLAGVLDGLRSAGIIVGDNTNGGRGWKDLTVRIDGSVVSVDVVCSLVEGVEFLLANINVQRVSQ